MKKKYGGKSGLKKYFGHLDFTLIGLCIVLALFGLMVIFSATHNTSYRYAITQGVGIFIGICVMFVMSQFTYDQLMALIKFYLPIVVLLMVLTLFFGITPAGTSNKAWLPIPLIGTIQPSELLKIAFIFTFAKHISLLGKNIQSLKGVLALLVHAGVIMSLVVIQKDWGTASVFLFIALVMMFAAGVQLRYFAVFGGVVLMSIPIIWNFVLQSYQKMRILAVYFPKLDKTGDWVYQQTQGKISIGAGGLWGYGWLLGPRTQAVRVPEQHNDFILAALGEEFGFIGCALVLILLCLVLMRILYTASYTKDPLGKSICMGVFSVILFQLIINVGMVLSLLPVVGVTLPFFSSGGTSVVVSFISMGMVLSVFRTRERSVFSGTIVRR